MRHSSNHGKTGVLEPDVQQIEFPLSVPVCAWCRPGSGGKGLKVISHGICLHHLRKMRLELMKRAAEVA